MTDTANWLGRRQVADDTLTPGLIARLGATLDTPPQGDGAAPQGVHWCLCLPDTPTALLDADGHPRRDAASLLPPSDLPRRMWAASNVRFIRPIRAGQAIRRTSTVHAAETKQGTSGQLLFVTLDHVTAADGADAVHEEQTIVYRAAATSAPPDAPTPFDAAKWHAARTIHPGPPLLLRYSALTFNSHRIHYDLPYARDGEGYRGLVVHGPLIATLLLDLVARHHGPDALSDFRFRAVRPAIAGDPLHLALRRMGDQLELAAYGPDGQCVEAAGTLARSNREMTPWP